MRLHFHLSMQQRQQLILGLSFVVPTLVMTMYFISRHMAPFGSSSLLTVDLGQQYVDFFAYFRHSLLHDPSGIFYTFQKALGGEMVSTWTYYLLSPFNLLLLFFPDHNLTSGIFLITVLKYGAAGLSFTWLLFKTGRQTGWATLGFSTSYALMGWMIANQLNLIWLDAVILLPLIILGLLRLIDTGKIRGYVGWLTAALVINYYMAYMMAIFVSLFFIWEITRRWTDRQTLVRQTIRFLGSSLLAGGLAAVTLLPTWAALQSSKATYTVTHWSFKFDYFPLKMLAKFFLGSFNFNQMPKGLPNIFVGSLVLIGVLTALLFKRRPRRQWLATLLVTFFLGLSLCFDPLNLIWHGLQYPIWYPYRFSFVVCFWLIWLAADALQPDLTLNLRQILMITIVASAVFVYIGLSLKAFDFLDDQQFIYGILFFVAALCLLALPRHDHQIFQLAFFLFAVVELSCNAIVSLNHISYVSNPEYQTYQKILTTQTDAVTRRDKGLYRLTPTFMRTKNDPLSGQYNGGSVFSSTLEKSMVTFMGNIGSPDGDGFVAYTNGTVLSDALLNDKYFINQQASTAGTKNPNKLNQTPLLTVSTRPDLASYMPIKHDGAITTYENQNALPMGFIADSDSLKGPLFSADPTQYQANLWASLTGRKADRQLFTAENFDRVVFNNVNQQTKLTGAILQKTNIMKPGSITFYFTPKTNNSFYLTLGGTISNTKASFTLNDKPLGQYPTYRNTIIVNLANHQKGKRVKLTVNLKKSSLWLQNFTLYQFNNPQFEQSLKRLQAHPLNIQHHSQSSLTGTITAPTNGAVLMTTIPYSTGWQATVDGHRVPVNKAAETFVALKLSKGHHTVSLTYWPPLLLPGLIITILCLTGIGLFVGFRYLQRRQN
ncbi:YfhO family protein [Secundilactobacillus kimchicus]|uniref:YfhO family protein n=1 Tax=Secundilactobacillus kimchicus TaxID=528209 RepID=UPI0024A8D4F8|nr:YfhO family protein [Secundilactobacillus kimchicus]